MIMRVFNSAYFITMIIQDNEHAIYLLNLGERGLLLPKLNYSFPRDLELIHMQFLSPFFIKSRQTFTIGAQDTNNIGAAFHSF